MCLENQEIFHISKSEKKATPNTGMMACTMLLERAQTFFHVRLLSWMSVMLPLLLRLPPSPCQLAMSFLLQAPIKDSMAFKPAIKYFHIFWDTMALM